MGFSTSPGLLCPSPPSLQTLSQASLAFLRMVLRTSFSFYVNDLLSHLFSKSHLLFRNQAKYGFLRTT